MPFPSQEKPLQRLQEWLLQNDYATTFSTTRNPLPVIEGGPHHIHLAPNAFPHAGCVHLVIPESLRLQVAANLHASHQELDSHAAEGKAVYLLAWIGGESAALKGVLHAMRDTWPFATAEMLVITPLPVNSGGYVPALRVHLHGLS